MVNCIYELPSWHKAIRQTQIHAQCTNFSFYFRFLLSSHIYIDTENKPNNLIYKCIIFITTPPSTLYLLFSLTVCHFFSLEPMSFCVCRSRFELMGQQAIFIAFIPVQCNIAGRSKCRHFVLFAFGGITRATVYRVMKTRVRVRHTWPVEMFLFWILWSMFCAECFRPAA